MKKRLCKLSLILIALFAVGAININAEAKRTTYSGSVTKYICPGDYVDITFTSTEKEMFQLPVTVYVPIQESYWESYFESSKDQYKAKYQELYGWDEDIDDWDEIWEFNRSEYWEEFYEEKNLDYWNGDIDDDGNWAYDAELQGRFYVQLYDSTGACVENDNWSLNGYCQEDDVEGWFISSSWNAGKYTYRLYNKTDAVISVKYKLYGFTGYAKSMKIPKKKTIKAGAYRKIGKFNSADKLLACEKSWKTKKKGIIDDVYVSASGNVYVWAKKNGTDTLTIKLYNGKSYKIKLTVTGADPDFTAYISSYNTRNNYFNVKIKNYGNTTLSIIRSGKAINSDYKTFDRYIKNMKTVNIKAGKSKTVRFYLKGRTTWYDCDDFTINAKIKYQGKKYNWRVTSETSKYKRGKKWYNTCQ